MTDTEQVRQISELVTHKVLEGFKKQLPCDKVQAMVHEHDRILHDGLRQDVAEIKEELKDERVARDKTRRRFFIAIAVVVFGFILRDVLPRVFGG